MHWQFAVLLGVAICAILVLMAFFLYSNSRVLYSVTRRMFRLRSDRTRVGSMTDVGCRG